jgi:hypothetical protein
MLSSKWVLDPRRKELPFSLCALTDLALLLHPDRCIFVKLDAIDSAACGSMEQEAQER